MVVTDVASGQPVVGRFGWKCQIGTSYLSRQRIPKRDGHHDPVLPERKPPAGGRRLARRQSGSDNPNDTNVTPMQFADFITFLAPRPSFPGRATQSLGSSYSNGSAAPLAISPAMQTGPNAVAALNRVAFFPFSDFLLHDMGSLNDGISIRRHGPGDADGAAVGRPDPDQLPPRWPRQDAPGSDPGPRRPGLGGPRPIRQLVGAQTAQLVEFINSL